MTAPAINASIRSRTTIAARLADRRWTANVTSLSLTQPELVTVAGDPPSAVEWVIARDGSLTTMTTDGSWWAGCSVPRLAAVKLLQSLERSPLVSAYLSPAHAELIHAARERMGPEPAMLALVPSVETFRMLLATGDFAADIDGHRMWFAVGDDWPEALCRLLVEHPGLPPAGRFVRTRLTDASVTEPMIFAAQEVFSSIASQRSGELETLRHRPRVARRIKRLLLISPSRYRLWDDGPEAVDEIARVFETGGGYDCVRFDSDDPISASPLALAMAASTCDAVFAANVFRGDAKSLVPDETPWMTWCTRLPIPPVEAAADRIIVADDSLAAPASAVGWPSTAILYGKPQMQPRCGEPTSPPHLAIIADLSAVAIPQSVEDLSSHRLLWEHIDAELEANPFAIGDDPVGYLLRVAADHDIRDGELDVRAFVDGLITPRWQRGVAKRLASSGIPMVIHGHGWNEEPSLAKLARGPVENREMFDHALDEAAALLYVWPGVAKHPIEASGSRVVRESGSLRVMVGAVCAALGLKSARPKRSVRPTAAVCELLSAL